MVIEQAPEQVLAQNVLGASGSGEPDRSDTGEGESVPGVGLSVVPWVVSAKSAQALVGQADRLLACVTESLELDPVDVGWSLARRSVFEHRAVVIGGDRQQLMAGLAGLVSGEPSVGVVSGRAHSVGKTVLVFPGQGSQWAGMGAQLLEASPVFAEAFRCGGAVSAIGGSVVAVAS